MKKAMNPTIVTSKYTSMNMSKNGLRIENGAVPGPNESIENSVNLKKFTRETTATNFHKGHKRSLRNLLSVRKGRKGVNCRFLKLTGSSINHKKSKEVDKLNFNNFKVQKKKVFNSYTASDFNSIIAK